MARNVSMEIPSRRTEPGARWLRCDLHVHTPFDKEKKFGEDIRGAIAALKKAKPEPLAQIADRFVQGCRNAANGEGMDLVALTDHNSIDGYRYLKPFLDALQVPSRDQGLQMPAILPGVEFSVGGERAIHFLVIFAADTSPDDIARAITHVFGTSDPFDPKSGTPRATGQSVIDFLEKLYEYCRPSSGERNLAFVILPAHVDRGQGLSKELGSNIPVRDTSVPTSIWDEMRGHLRQRTIVSQGLAGFPGCGRIRKSPASLQGPLVPMGCSTALGGLGRPDSGPEGSISGAEALADRSVLGPAQVRRHRKFLHLVEDGSAGRRGDPSRIARSRVAVATNG